MNGYTAIRKTVSDGVRRCFLRVKTKALQRQKPKKGTKGEEERWRTQGSRRSDSEVQWVVVVVQSQEKRIKRHKLGGKHVSEVVSKRRKHTIWAVLRETKTEQKGRTKLPCWRLSQELKQFRG